MSHANETGATRVPGMAGGTPQFDVAVVGSGITGLATAMAMTSQWRLSLVVIEAEDQLAAHQTGNNSGAIHSGLYRKPGSLKARLCAEGREALYLAARSGGDTGTPRLLASHRPALAKWASARCIAR